VTELSALADTPAVAVPPRSGVVLSVVVPFYNEGANVEALFARLVPALDAIGLPWEVVCVNDGSRDDTWDRLTAASTADRRIRALDLSRNFGKEIALSAGLAATSGQAVVPMDADLQHPPEFIAELVAKWREGYEVVYATRTDRDDQSTSGRLASQAFYWVFDNLSDIKLPHGAGDFRLLDRKVVDVINAMPERNRFMKGIFAWVGFRQAGVPCKFAARETGTTKWGIIKLIRFAFAGLTAFSNFPLRVWGGVGAMISGFAFLYIVVRLLRTLFYGIDVPGYESIIVAILFLGGMQLLTLGILGDYLGRVFDEAKGRPLYVVRERLGFGERTASTREAEATVGP
jgi:glycosyltransferase involved in cell wall biosynthesis